MQNTRGPSATSAPSIAMGFGLGFAVGASAGVLTVLVMSWWVAPQALFSNLVRLDVTSDNLASASIVAVISSLAGAFVGAITVARARQGYTRGHYGVAIALSVALPILFTLPTLFTGGIGAFAAVYATVVAILFLPFGLVVYLCLREVHSQSTPNLRTGAQTQPIIAAQSRQIGAYSVPQLIAVVLGALLLSWWGWQLWATLTSAGRFNIYESFDPPCIRMIGPGDEFWRYNRFWVYSALALPGVVALVWASSWVLKGNWRPRSQVFIVWGILGAGVAASWWLAVLAYDPVLYGYSAPSERIEHARTPDGYFSCGPELPPDGMQAAALALGVVAVPLVASGRARKPIEWVVVIASSLLPALVLVPFNTAIVAAGYFQTSALLLQTTWLAFALSVTGLEFCASRLDVRRAVIVTGWFVIAGLTLTSTLVLFSQAS